MKQHLKELLAQSVGVLCRQGVLAQGVEESIRIERPRNPRHGEFASSLALTLAKSAKRDPRVLARMLVDALPDSALLERAEVAGNGFINFFLSRAAWRAVIDEIRRDGENHGRSAVGRGRKILVEFVSANPTGPLHIGHGRGAAYGDTVARLLDAVGYQVEREYYVNDAGRQMDILALSVWLRYLEHCGESIEFPLNGYHGAYIRDIAAALHDRHGEAFRVEIAELFKALPEADEERIDELIRRSKSTLGEGAYQTVLAHGSDTMVEDIRQDLDEFGVRFDHWFSERTLLESGDIERAVEKLADNGHIREEKGVKWFKSTDFGDDKDRAVVRANGTHTYFAADIAYHFNKGERGYDVMLDVMGADHHGYASRIQAAYQALGYERDRLQVRLVQFAVLYRGGCKAPMSTRSGEFVTLRELRKEVGNDAARFFYVLRKNDQHMDFDLDLARTQSADNPVYYIQYAHARICSVFRRLPQKRIPPPDEVAPDYDLLVEPGEFELMQTLSRFPEVVEQAAGGFEPHLLAYYLRELANDFHAYYNAHPFLSGEADLRLARLGLIDATRQVIANGLRLLGVAAPEKM